MHNIVTANELKLKGIKALDSIMEKNGEAIISVRGKNKFVILTMSEYNHLRECELEAALIEAQNDLSNGRFTQGSVEEHIKRITDG